MKLSVVSIDTQLVRVEAQGDITMRDFRADGPDPFETLLGAGWAAHKLVLDFSRVGFVDSSAIGWLMTCRRAFDRAGGLFLVHSIQPRVRQVLDLLRVGKALPLLDDEQAALTVAAASVVGLTLSQAEPSAAVGAIAVAAVATTSEGAPAAKPRARKRKAA